jgi:hypothetical protein
MLSFFASPKQASDEPGRTGTIVKICLAVALLGLAAFFAFRGSSENEQLDTPESAVTYICWDDGYTFKLTPAQWDKLLKQGEIGHVAKGAAGAVSGVRQQRGGSTGGPIRAVRCPKCGKFTCVMALDCPDGTQVPSITADGQIGRCPPDAESSRTNGRQR